MLRQGWRALEAALRRRPQPAFRNSSTASAPRPEPPLGRMVLQFAQCAGFVWLVDRYGIFLSMTQGPSMLPTLNEIGDIVVVDRFSIAAGLDPIHRNDIVIADSPGKPEPFHVCKRVIALEGDYIQPSGRDFFIQIPAGHVWLEGDNPRNSADSRGYGPVPESMVHGRVVSRVWPFTQACWIHRDAGRPHDSTKVFSALPAAADTEDDSEVAEVTAITSEVAADGSS